MLTELCGEIRNYFLRDYRKDIHAGRFVISNGSIEPLSFLQDGQYYRIKNSVMNDGVYQYPNSTLTDEVFVGEIWAMAVPPAVIALSHEIEEWISANKDALSTPYQSESFGGYSYNLKSGATNENGGGGSISWQMQFANKLNRYRRISEL